MEVFYMKNENKAIIPLRVSICLSALVALSIVCGKYLAINIPPVMRFSFESMPIIFAGIVFGPVAGAIVGVVADLVGCLLVGYETIPLITIGAGLIGLSSGVMGVAFRKKDGYGIAQIALSTLLAHAVGSVVVKTLGLAEFYAMPFYALLLWRTLNYAIIGVLEILILYFLLKNSNVRRAIERIKRGNKR